MQIFNMCNILSENFELRFHVTTFAEWKSRKERLSILNWMVNTTIMAISKRYVTNGIKMPLEFHTTTLKTITSLMISLIGMIGA